MGERGNGSAEQRWQAILVMGWRRPGKAGDYNRQPPATHEVAVFVSIDHVHPQGHRVAGF